MEIKGCIKCSKKILINERFCRYCGADNSEEAIRAKTEAEEKKRLEEARHREEERRREEERKRLAEEKKRLEEARHQEEERKHLEEERYLAEEKRCNERKTSIISDTKEILLLYGYTLVSNVISLKGLIYFIVSNEEGCYLVWDEICGTNFMINKISVPIDSRHQHFFLGCSFLDVDEFYLRVGDRSFFINSHGEQCSPEGMYPHIFFSKAAIRDDRVIIEENSGGDIKKIIELSFDGLNITDACVVGWGEEPSSVVLKCFADSKCFFISLSLIEKELNCFVCEGLEDRNSISIIENDKVDSSWAVHVQEYCGQMSYDSENNVLSYWNDKGGLMYHRLGRGDKLNIYDNNYSLRNKPIIVAGEEVDLYGDDSGYCLRYKHENGVEKYHIHMDSRMKMYCSEGRTIYGIENGDVYLFFDGGIVNKVIKFE